MFNIYSLINFSLFDDYFKFLWHFIKNLSFSLMIIIAGKFMVKLSKKQKRYK